MTDAGNKTAPTGAGLHVCCAPCLARTRESWRLESDRACPEVAGLYFFNPNIHPLLEFRRRIKALRIYLERDSLPAEIDDGYGLTEFLNLMVADGGVPKSRRDRCYKCYMLRLGKAAGYFGRLGLSAFSSTLLASHQQDLDLIASAGREAGEQQDIEFISGNFGLREPEARLLRGIYKQQYCGCIFSEEERYRNTNKHLFRPEDEGS